MHAAPASVGKEIIRGARGRRWPTRWPVQLPRPLYSTSGRIRVLGTRRRTRLSAYAPSLSRANGECLGSLRSDMDELEAVGEVKHTRRDTR